MTNASQLSPPPAHDLQLPFLAYQGNVQFSNKDKCFVFIEIAFILVRLSLGGEVSKHFLQRLPTWLHGKTDIATIAKHDDR